MLFLPTRKGVRFPLKYGHVEQQVVEVDHGRRSDRLRRSAARSMKGRNPGYGYPSGKVCRREATGFENLPLLD